MEFIATKSDLQRELSAAFSVIEKKSAMIPILQFFRINSVGNDAIDITATDLDTSLTTRCKAQVVKPGTMLVHAIKLVEIVKSLPDADIYLTRNKQNWAELQCARSKFRIAGKPEEDFPITQDMQETNLSIDADVLRYFIEHTIFAITRQESQRYALCGAQFTIEPDLIRMVATDGHRLSIVERSGIITSAKEEATALIPLKALNELFNLCSNIPASSEDKVVHFSFTDNHLFFRLAERALISRTLTGKFPDYKLVVPKQSTLVINAEKAALAGAIKRVALMSDARCRGIKFFFNDNRCEIVAQHSEIGEARETVAIEYNGPQFDVGFNAEYLLDYLEVCDTAETTISFKEPSSQALFQPKGDTAYNNRYVAMPMRI